ncbi:MAG TPA: enoyl-CoA hydratase/isomerase family protein [Allosphingosinicella sp.]|nr:enoyl-CoA hydratase/isomerase family protein [Allosphingosinicella sp.]
MFNLSIEEGIGLLRLARPEARNAISVDGWAALGDAAEEAVQREARLLIVRGEPGGAFSSGADLGDFDGFADDPVGRTAFREEMRGGLDRVRDVPIPTIAVIEGACFGAGLALAMACDIRFAGPGAFFAITPAKLGISYPQEDVHRLVALVGAGQAAQLLLTAQRIDGAEAERIGLVEKYFEAGLAEAVNSIAGAVAANDPESLRTLKDSIRLASTGVSQDEAQDCAYDDMLGSNAMLERLARHRSRPR